MASTVILPQAVEFLNALYGPDPSGFRTVYTKDDKVSRWLEARQVDETINISSNLTKMYDVYFNIGLQSQKLGRKKRGGSETVIAIPGLWQDVDCQGGAHAATNLPTFEEAKEFLNEFPLRPSILVHSGGGLYPYWVFPELWVFKDKADHDKAVTMLTRFKTAFVALAASRGWKLDSTSDLARVLRLPGMLNHKYSPPAEVKLLEFHPDRRYTREEITEAIDAMAAKVPKQKQRATRQTQETSADESQPDLEAILERCTFLRHCRDDAATLPEPEWYAMTSIIARAKDGEKRVHEYSCSYPQYSERETDEKIRHALKDAGPYTCDRIRADFCYCDGCKEQVTSPLALGRPKTAPANDLAEKAKLLQDSPYALNGFTTCYQKERHTQGGGTEVITERLCNFTAWQEEKRTLDDGSGETRQIFLMKGRTQDGRWLPEIEIPATGFAGLQWVMANWSPRAIVAAGFSNRDRLREAVELLSQGLSERHIYTHTGWRHIDGKWVFLHAGGAIGCDDGIEVQLPKELTGYILPESAGDLRAAIRASLRFLEVGRPEVTYTLWAAMWRAVVAEFLYPGFTLWLRGRTNLFKSTLAALALCHFGRFTTDSLPAGWMSTDNSLEKLSFWAKDLPLVIDDYAPEKDVNQARALEKKANRLLRTTANRTARGRLKSDLSAAPIYDPRDLPIATGEQLPDSIQSVLARFLSVKFEPGSVDKQKLTQAQAEAGLYAQAMRGFIEWLLPRADGLRDELQEVFLKYRNRAQNGLPRLAETTAHIQIGFMLGLKFAFDSGVIDADKYREQERQAWEIFTKLAQEQERIIEQERPALLFIRALQNLFIQGKAHLRDRRTDSEPDQADEWGWQKATAMAGRIPGGDFLGWVDDEALYLLPEGSYKAVAEFYRVSGGFPVSERALREHLKQGGFSETDSGRLTKNVRVGAKTHSVFNIAKTYISLPPTETVNTANTANSEERIQ